MCIPKLRHGQEVPLRIASPADQEGIAVLVALIALTMFSLLGLYMVFTSTTDVKISDNYESELQARFAAQAGLSHARELMEGMAFNDLLQGPDGTYDSSPGYMSQARTFGFRNLVSWTTARSLNILDPTNDVSTIPDDGLINTGKYGATSGTVLIPLTGIAQTAPNPYGAGTITTSRYFFKVTDNNGEATELAGDPSDNPFVDGDGIVIGRSVGVAQTIRETAGATIRRNSVAVFEVRFKQRSTFNLDSPLVVEGDAVLPSASNMFDGNSFGIQGGSQVGLATIDVNTANSVYPSQQVSSQLAPNQTDNISGAGLEPSIMDITGSVSANEDKALLLSKEYLYNFVNSVVPQFADSSYSGNQSWSGGSAPDIGYFDPSLPANAPGQRPRVTYVNGDLSVSGDMEGGGLLVVTGKFTSSGRFTYNGLVLVVGTGDMDAGGLNRGVYGGVYITSVTNSGGVISWGTPKLSMSGNSDIIINSNAIGMAMRLIPASQTAFREITSAMDP